MGRASPLIRSFNAGEFSALVEGRTDVDRYPASNRQMLNGVAAPQGPFIPRSGTAFMGAAYKHDEASVLIPFVFDEDDSFQIEFADEKVRFWTDEGLLVKPFVAMVVDDDSPFTFTSAALTAQGAAVGMQVAFSAFPDSYNLNAEVGTILTKVGDVYTVDLVHPALPLLNTATVALVYSIDSPYTEAQVGKIFELQSIDVLYLFHPEVVPYKLKRADTYSWSFEEVVFEDGPYMDINETSTKLTPNVTGNHVPTLTANNAPAGNTAFGSTINGTDDYFKAFDDPDADTYWSSNTSQTGIIGYRANGAPFVCDGYSIHIARNNADTSYQAKDYAPSTFLFEGSNDGSNYTTLDSRNVYVLYNSNKSLFFKIKNTTAYEYYRLNIITTTRNGAIAPRVRRLVLRSTTSTAITFTASSTAGINNGQGFLATDIGRLFRFKGTDGDWRSFKITDVNSTTEIETTLLGEPLPNIKGSTEWRLGYWSDTTGWPSTADFYQDRLWLGPCDLFPDLIVASVTGQYENMAQSDPDGVVLDTSAMVLRLNSRRLSRVKWIAGGDKGVLVGTGSQEFVITAGEFSDKTITPSNVKAKPSSSRGSADTPPVLIDAQLLYMQRSGRTLREFAYVYEADGYKSPSMSTLASHLGISPMVQMEYAAEPYSIVWLRRANGTVVGLTYNREENVVGWHRHDFSGGIVESLCVVPSVSGLQDDLWMIIRRTVDGEERRYVEKLTRFWDFDMTIDEAHFVDCALRYEGDPTVEIFGFQHLEGRTDIYGLADGIPVGPLTVQDGKITLDHEASTGIFGIGFESLGETSRLENGAEDGTALGKVKRIKGISLNVWQSATGDIGTWNEDTQEIEWQAISSFYPGDESEIETLNLFTGIIGPATPAPGWEKRGSVFFRRRKDQPLPYNIVALMPQLEVSDR